MANGTTYTRAYSNSSAGGLVCGKGPNGNPLPDRALLEEFRNHAITQNRQPTALVSVSNRIVDTLKRAFDKHYQDGESSADIWIAFIVVPTGSVAGIHSAKKLAERCGHSRPYLFSHEVVFEWAIPEKYVVHEVSLQTLMERKLQERCFFEPPSSTMDVCCRIARKLHRQDPWETGIALGFIAQTFGARAPLQWISYQLFYDCVYTQIIDEDVVRLDYRHGPTEIVDFPFFCEFEDGFRTSLVDWWLSGLEFFLAQKKLKEWRHTTEESMGWELIEFEEAWHRVDCDGWTRELSVMERLSYDKAKKELLAEHKDAIEVEAVRIGL